MKKVNNKNNKCTTKNYVAHTLFYRDRKLRFCPIFIIFDLEGVNIFLSSSDFFENSDSHTICSDINDVPSEIINALVIKKTFDTLYDDDRQLSNPNIISIIELPRNMKYSGLEKIYCNNND